MTDTRHHEHRATEAHAPIVQEPDRIPAVPVVVIVVLTLGLIGLGVAWPWWILAGGTPEEEPRFELGTEPRVTHPQPRIIGGMAQTRSAETALDRPVRENAAPGARRDRDRGDRGAAERRQAGERTGTAQAREGESGASAPEPAGGAPVDPAWAYSIDRFQWVDRERGIVDLPAGVAAELWLARDARERSKRGSRESDEAADGERP